ncbi:MAG: ADP-ribosylglycohydrolase family protein [Oscillospiraceae bacterium]|nr:ADP-ribosylglycohydrolase family protein [Oscillospiraceae bacterium]
MYGAILGDMIGSPYEFNSNNYKAKDFPLFSESSSFTDDSVMTLAVAEAFMQADPDADDAAITGSLFRVMPEIGRRYPDCGYGGRFAYWIMVDDPEPYNSYGNGSGMRVSPVAWFYNDISAVRHAARLSACVSHNHPEGYKGAEAVASAIFLARTGHGKEEIRSYVVSEFGYDLSRTCDEIRPGYRMDETCQGSVPEAITAFLEGTDFEDVIRTAVSLGGDSDTIACMAGAIAEGFYGVSEELKAECRRRLTPDLLEILERFTSCIEKRRR